MKGNQITSPTLIEDPEMTLECLEGKTVGKVILQIMTKDKGQRNPLFWHFKKDWHWNIEDQSFSLVAHSALEKEARQCAYTLKNYLIEKYGEGILDAFKSGLSGLNNPYDTYEDDDLELDFDMEDDNEDKFINNIVQETNMDLVTETETNTNVATIRDLQ